MSTCPVYHGADVVLHDGDFDNCGHHRTVILQPSDTMFITLSQNNKDSLTEVCLLWCDIIKEFTASYQERNYRDLNNTVNTLKTFKTEREKC